MYYIVYCVVIESICCDPATIPPMWDQQSLYYLILPLR